MASGLGDQLATAFKSGHSAGMDTAHQMRIDNGGTYTKAEVNYRKCDPNSTDCCGNCQHFDGTSKCDIVSGKISESMVCDKYESAQNSDTTTGASQSTTEPA